MVDHIKCADILEVAEGVMEDFSISKFHSVINLAFQGYVSVVLPSVHLEEFIEILVDMSDVG